MEVVTTGLLTASSLTWQRSDNSWVQAVACKATYRLAPGFSTLVKEQLPINEGDNYWNDDPRHSLYAPSDLVPFRRRADVLLVGRAFAPPGQRVRSLRTRLSVGSVDKSVEVWCDRWWTGQGDLAEGSPFEHMPLRWERAAGGPDTTNPAGMAFDVEPDSYGNFRIPNLQPPGTRVASRNDTFPPIGYGPIAPHWPDRAGKLGRYATHWSHTHWSHYPLPPDIDGGYFNAAPVDQQLDQLRPDATILMENLLPTYAVLETRLEPVSPYATAERGGRRDPIDLVCDTLWIDTEQVCGTLVWHGSIALRSHDEAGRIVVSAQAERRTATLTGIGKRPLRYEPDSDADQTGLVRSGAAVTQEELESGKTMRIQCKGPRQALPFRAGAPAPLPSSQAVEPAASDPQPSPMGFEGLKGIPASGETMALRPVRAIPQPLPFERSRAAGAYGSQASSGPAEPAGAEIYDPDTEVTEVDDAAILAALHRPVLPFEPATPPRDTLAGSSPQPDAEAQLALSEGTVDTSLSPPVVSQATPFESDAPKEVAPPVPPPARSLHIDPLKGAPRPAAQGGEPPQPVPPPAFLSPSEPEPSLQPSTGYQDTPQAPAIMGPLATPEMVQTEPPPQAVEPAPEAPPEPEPPPEPELPLDDYPLERCAAIAAELHCRPQEREEILTEHDLEPPIWVRLEEHYSDAIEQEAFRGKTKLLKSYDRAYVEQVEKERGAIEPEEYARICVAVERNYAGEMLEELHVPRQALMRIERVWLGRVMDDSALRKRVREAVAKARDA